MGKPDLLGDVDEVNEWFTAVVIEVAERAIPQSRGRWSRGGLRSVSRR